MLLCDNTLSHQPSSTRVEGGRGRERESTSALRYVTYKGIDTYMALWTAVSFLIAAQSAFGQIYTIVEFEECRAFDCQVVEIIIELAVRYSTFYRPLLYFQSVMFSINIRSYCCVQMQQSQVSTESSLDVERVELFVLLVLFDGFFLSVRSYLICWLFAFISLSPPSPFSSG